MNAPTILPPSGRPVQTDPVLAEFYEHTRSLKQAQIDFLAKRHAVPVLALVEDGDGGGIALGAAPVMFYKCGRFDFADGHDNAVAAIIAVLRDRDDYALDIAAWAPRSGMLGTLLGRAVLAGEHELDAQRLDDVLRVHRSFLDWLKCGRKGLVVLDPGRAWQFLHREELAAADVSHGLELRKMLRPPAPKIVVPALEAA